MTGVGLIGEVVDVINWGVTWKCSGILFEVLSESIEVEVTTGFAEGRKEHPRVQ